MLCRIYYYDAGEALCDISHARLCAIRANARITARSVRRQSAACVEYREPITINCAHRGARHFARDFAINKNQPQLIDVRYACAETLDGKKKRDKEREREGGGGMKIAALLANAYFSRSPCYYEACYHVRSPAEFHSNEILSRAATPVFFLRLSIFRQNTVGTHRLKKNRPTHSRRAATAKRCLFLAIFENSSFLSLRTFKRVTVRFNDDRDVKREREKRDLEEISPHDSHTHVFDVEYDFLSLLSMKMQNDLM